MSTSQTSTHSRYENIYYPDGTSCTDLEHDYVTATTNKKTGAVSYKSTVSYGVRNGTIFSTWTPNVSVKLNNKAPSANTFKFTLYKGSSALQSKYNTSSGAVSFSAIKFNCGNLDKSYTYTVKETASATSGVTRDTHAVTSENFPKETITVPQMLDNSNIS